MTKDIKQIHELKPRFELRLKELLTQLLQGDYRVITRGIATKEHEVTTSQFQEELNSYLRIAIGGFPEIAQLNPHICFNEEKYKIDIEYENN